MRYALGALKNVGAKAMETAVEARGNGYGALPDFAARVDPKLLNKRQLESLIGAGCFDAVEPNRAGVFLLAEAILGTAQAAADARTSAQSALFGEHNDRGMAMIVPNASWTMAEAMAQEKEAFGFYFSGHPVEAWRPVLDANGVRTFAEVSAMPAPAGGGRLPCAMAGLIEEAKWRTPQKGSGNRYLLLTLSDRSGQYIASCFEESCQERLEIAAKDGVAIMVQTELQWREGEDTPRVTVRGFTPLAEMAKRTRGRLVVSVADAGEAAALAGLVAEAKGRGRGELVAGVVTAAGEARIVLGRDYLFDAELHAALVSAFGVDRAVSEAVEPVRLALVG